LRSCAAPTPKPLHSGDGSGVAMPWLLLRGLGREQRHFQHFSALLRSQLGAEAVLHIDLAGAGTEFRRRPASCVPWLARDVAGRLASVAPSGASPANETDWWLLGLSLGGMVALELCRIWAWRVRGCVVINSSSRITAPAGRLRPSALPRLLAIAASRNETARETKLLRLTSELPSAERARWARVSASFAREAPVSRCTMARQLWAAAHFQPPLPAEVPVPLLFLGSRRDRLVNPEASRSLARYYSAPYAEHPWAGHDLPLDDPAWVCEHALGFRDRVHRAVMGC
jgi:pimeloyl-ACP methyl ester carboxylesterase